MQLLGQTPVYLVDCVGKDKSHVMVGLIPTPTVEILYNLCEKEFDWMCGFEDSGFTKDGCTIFIEDGFGCLSNAWTAMKVQEFVNRLSDGWNRPSYFFHAKRI